jgi:hypothetical protein
MLAGLASTRASTGTKRWWVKGKGLRAQPQLGTRAQPGTAGAARLSRHSRCAGAPGRACIASAAVLRVPAWCKPKARWSLDRCVRGRMVSGFRR